MWQRIMVIFVIGGVHFTDANQVSEILGPCDFMETINITSGHLDQHGNYLYNGNVFKKGSYGEYRYAIENRTTVKVDSHVRGCICHLKPCIRLCCTEEIANGSCVTSNTLLVPTLDDEEEIDVTGKKFGVLVGRPCDVMYRLDPVIYDDDKWYFLVSAECYFEVILD